MHNGRELLMIKWMILNTSYVRHNPTVSSIGEGTHERDSHGYAHSWQVLIKLTSSYLEPVLNKVSTLPHNRGHGFPKDLTLQGCSN